MRQSCVLSLQEMRNLPTDLPLKATADAWEDLGRAITDEAQRQTIGGLVYYPQWTTAPYSAIH
ncbi:hypothetical protein ACIUYZ_00045 [Pseudomonas aeruginosa]